MLKILQLLFVIMRVCVFTVAAVESNDSVILQQLTNVALQYERILAGKKMEGQLYKQEEGQN